jgi:hypothetical protein
MREKDSYSNLLFRLGNKRYTVSRCNITQTPTGAWNVLPERRSQGWYILRVNVCFPLAVDALGTFDVEEIACS